MICTITRRGIRSGRLSRRGRAENPERRTRSFLAAPRPFQTTGVDGRPVCQG